MSLSCIYGFNSLLVSTKSSTCMSLSVFNVLAPNIKVATNIINPTIIPKTYQIFFLFLDTISL